ncbi:hypothetical protein SISSUDRAFT_1068136 [Sistotremastrum suecicum HHB10207 ss-3]|uniref:Uncharacterized protein n=1 Tax=Sistotremastrum suecicum HHB10207 ss-3 TaxID=1314776 RepID=A0A165WF31_9AGAM|nr:hypothetical protein SISSUDRAFT_1068136 [Sistotremastrum suecicum HHB10207 ss-3]
MLTSAAVQPVLVRPHLHPPYSPPYVSPHRRTPPSTTLINPSSSSRQYIPPSKPSPSPSPLLNHLAKHPDQDQTSQYSRTEQAIPTTYHHLLDGIILRHHHRRSQHPKEIKAARFEIVLRSLSSLALKLNDEA